MLSLLTDIAIKVFSILRKRDIMSGLVCSFFGHRKIEITEELKQRVKNIVEDFIVNHNVLTF